MLFPDPTGANPLPAGEAEPLPGAEDGWLLSCAAPGEFLLLIAATEPIGPLEDARPLTPSRSTTGRRGEPRLKPVTVRGLFRRLGEIDPRRFGPLAGEEPQALLSSAAIELQTGRLVSLPVPGVCLARIALTEAADER
jgi:hypothetical protein